MIISGDKIKAISMADEIYPELLRVIDNPPKRLYYRGNPKLLHTSCLAIVGARKSTSYGRWAAYNISKKVSEHNVTIVSGMAAGIDTCGHLGALDTGGKTIAVLGCGIDICYPKANSALMERIIKHGLVVSEYPPGTEPMSWRFPERNRIISGLSYAVTVVEAGLKSGSLITAGLALNQGREVFAVPGNIDNIFSKGTNKLIQDGATPLIDLDDILSHLGIGQNIKSTKTDYSDLGKDERHILKTVNDYGSLTPDRLCTLCGKPPSTIGALVTVLEMKGRLMVTMGKIHVAK